MQLNEDLSVGIEAFSRIAPSVPIIANVIISENLFEVLATSTGGRLQFSTYDKYLSGLERYILQLNLHCTHISGNKNVLDKKNRNSRR